MNCSVWRVLHNLEFILLYRLLQFSKVYRGKKFIRLNLLINIYMLDLFLNHQAPITFTAVMTMLK